MSDNSLSPLVGRGSHIQPPNRFVRIEVHDDFEHLAADAEELAARLPRTEYYVDDSRSLISENDSPDVFFRHGVNP